MRPVKKIRRK